MNKGYGDFCPVAKTAELFAQRWTPLIVRELLLGPKGFGDLKTALALMSRSMLAARLKELEASGIIMPAVLPPDGRKVYCLTEAGEAFRAVIEHLSIWGQTYARDQVGPGDLNPTGLLWAMKTHAHDIELPPQPFVVEFELRGIPRGQTQRRRWWLLLRQPEIEVCLKWPGYETDVLVRAELDALTRCWLGYLGCREAEAGDLIAFEGSPAATRRCKALLGFGDAPHLRRLAFFRPETALAA